MELAELRSVLIPGTINAGGTLSSELDIGSFSLFGLDVLSMLNSKLSFMGSALSDAEGGVYKDIKDEIGNTRSIGPSGTSLAVSSDKITQIISGWRYVRLKSAAAQTNGVLFYIPAKP